MCCAARITPNFLVPQIKTLLLLHVIIMAIVYHKIKGKLYAYDHNRVGDKIVTTYLYPVGVDLKYRSPEHGGGRK